MSGCAPPPPDGYQFDSPAAAVTAMLARGRPVGVEAVDLADAAGRVLGAALHTDRDSPAVDVSAMDGFAVRAADVGKGTLPIAGEVRIGLEPPGLPPMTALRIVTGGAIPAGADAVVRHEDVREEGGRMRLAESVEGIKPGQSIRRRGENLARGGLVVEAGSVVSAAVAGALATFGVVRPSVFRSVRVAILTTGDEVLPPDQSPTPWQLRDSNGPALRAMLGARRWLEIRGTERCPDDPARLRAAAERLLADADCLILTGGVSMGHRDFIPAMLAGLGAERVFHKVPQRPGKPIFAAVLPDGRPVLGLPGNPVSVLVTARRFAVPILERMSGLTRGSVPGLVRLEGAGDRSLDLWWHRLARLTGPGEARSVDAVGSGDVPGAAGSDGFCEVPPGRCGSGPWPFYAWL